MSSPVRDLTLIRRPSRGPNHGRTPENPDGSHDFAAFVIPGCRDLPGSIDRRIDRTPGVAGQQHPCL